MCTGPQSVLYEHIRFEMTWTDYRHHRYCVILETRVRVCVFLGLSQLISENSTAANDEHGTSSATGTVLLHVVADRVPHHGGIFFQFIQLHALPPHVLLITPELLLKFCNKI